jgi:putative ABC transport system permease protein
MNELEQIETLATVLPLIFLSVAAFLSHMVLSRLIATERGEIGLFRAFGYSTWQIGWHYTKFVIAIALLGSSIGWVLGGLFGRYNTQLYTEFFRFPLLIYRPSATAFAVGAAVSLAATLVGALGAVRRAVALPPAEAMQPPAPPVYRRGGLGVDSARWLDQPTRIALRQIGRWPVRAGLTCLGIALSVALLVMSLQWNDSIEQVAQAYFFQAQHQSMSIGLVEPQPLTAINDFEHLPGVLRAEGWRAVAADFSVGTTEHRGTIVGVVPGDELQPIHDDATGRNLTVPPAGLVLGSYLAAKLGVGVGEEVWVDVREERRPSGYVTVADVFETTIAMPAYMELDALNRWLEVRPLVEYLNVLVDTRAQAELFAELKQMPAISAIMLRQAAIDAFYDTLAENMLVYIWIFTGFACALGFGVAYNSTRIALSERGRELATLRVLGFTRAEISYILLGEVAILILAALPLGCLAGRGLTFVIARAFDTELFRMPLVVTASTYGLGVGFAIFATAASAALVGRRVRRLDLIRVLKTREGLS